MFWTCLNSYFPLTDVLVFLKKCLLLHLIQLLFYPFFSISVVIEFIIVEYFELVMFRMGSKSFALKFSLTNIFYLHIFDILKNKLFKFDLSLILNFMISIVYHLSISLSPLYYLGDLINFYKVFLYFSFD